MLHRVLIPYIINEGLLCLGGSDTTMWLPNRLENAFAFSAESLQIRVREEKTFATGNKNSREALRGKRRQTYFNLKYQE